MNVISPHQQELIESLQASGEYTSESEVLDEALELLRQRSEIRRRLAVATGEFQRGEGVPSELVIRQLNEELNEAS